MLEDTFPLFLPKPDDTRRIVADRQERPGQTALPPAAGPGRGLVEQRKRELARRSAPGPASGRALVEQRKRELELR